MSRSGIEVLRGAMVVGVATLALAGCDLVQAPENGDGKAGQTSAPARDGAFSHSQSEDISGYYRASGASVGGLTLSQVFVGQTADFEAWEAGRRSTTFAPIMIEFEDASSPMVQTEMGESRSGRARVLPTSYRVSDDRVRFEGRSQALGLVRFEGRLDPEALAEARRNLGDETPVLSGTLNVAGRSQSVRLRWWAGD